MTETAPLPMALTIEDIHGLLSREDNRYTVTRAVQLPATPEDESPRCAIIMAGPESAVLLSYLLDYVDGLVKASQESKREVH